MENNTISVSVERYEQLIGMEARCKVLEAYTVNSPYSLDRETVAWIIGFKLSKENE